jgi:hypothetical protein
MVEAAGVEPATISIGPLIPTHLTAHFTRCSLVIRGSLRRFAAKSSGFVLYAP